MWEVCQQWQWPSSHDPVPEADRDVKQGHYSVSQSCTGNITCIVIYILLLVVHAYFPETRKKRLLLFFILIILIDIQNICSINSRALAVGLMAWSDRKPIYSSRYQYGLPKMHFISMKPSTTQKLCSAFNTAGWLGAGVQDDSCFKTFRLFTSVDKKNCSGQTRKQWAGSHLPIAQKHLA